MAGTEYAAGLQFVSHSSCRKPGKRDSWIVKSHATKARRKNRQVPRIRSWMFPDRELGAPSKNQHEQAEHIPAECGATFSGLQLPAGFEPREIQSLVKLIDINREGLYPYEICLDVHPFERGWFPYMISDVCCLHSMLFSVHALEAKLAQASLGFLAYHHYEQAIQTLQARLDSLDQASATSDGTIMTVITLASVAELGQDYSIANAHLRGLQQIVKIRGGIKALDTYRNMPVKVCRAFTSYAMATNERPFVFWDSVCWDAFIADWGHARCIHSTGDRGLKALETISLNSRLMIVLEDIHAFSCISNLAYQTTRKLAPETYNEAMISVFYRLMHLSFEHCSLEEVMRLGLLCFCSTIFLQHRYNHSAHHSLLLRFSKALDNMRNTQLTEMPAAITLWLAMLPCVLDSSLERYSTWLAEVVDDHGIISWSQGRETLRSVAWVDFVHDLPGEKAFLEARTQDVE